MFQIKKQDKVLEINPNEVEISNLWIKNSKHSHKNAQWAQEKNTRTLWELWQRTRKD